MNAKIGAVTTLVRKFHDHVSKAGSGEIYLTQLKQLMENSEAFITEFKNHHRALYVRS